MTTITDRLRTLERRAGHDQRWLCNAWREHDVRPPCRDVAGFLALVPRVEAGSDEDWRTTRQAALQVLERQP